MNKKLTLKLDGDVIERAKVYAANNHQSVSGLVERLLKSITEDLYVKNTIKNSVMREVSGLIVLPEGYDEREDYRLSRTRDQHG